MICLSFDNLSVNGKRFEIHENVKIQFEITDRPFNHIKISKWAVLQNTVGSVKSLLYTVKDKLSKI